MAIKIEFDKSTLDKVEAKLTKQSNDKLVDHFLRQGKSLLQAYDLIATICELEGIEQCYGCYESFRTNYYRRTRSHSSVYHV